VKFFRVLRKLYYVCYMNGIIKEKVKASGFKYNHLAKLLGIHPQYFYMVMRGDRFLSPERENKLREILKSIELPSTTAA
jgi:hypothetical protein